MSQQHYTMRHSSIVFNYSNRGNQIPARHRSNYKPNNATSMIKGLMPDTYTMSFINNNIAIKDDLKTSVRRVLY